MDPKQTKFYQASIELVGAGGNLELRGLVSEVGVTKIYLPSGLPEAWKARIGQTVKIKLDGLILEASLNQQFVEHGTFYELRFKDLEEPHRNYIRQRIAAEGISPGWKRKFPRIPVGKQDDPELPVPSLCMVRFVGQEIFVNVINFTLGGLRIETLGDNLVELRVGSVIHFDLVASNGVTMPNLSADVRNIAVHEHDKNGQKYTTRSFGLRFVNLDPVNERRYRDLIRDYCLVMRKRFEDFEGDGEA